MCPVPKNDNELQKFNGNYYTHEPYTTNAAIQPQQPPLQQSQNQTNTMQYWPQNSPNDISFTGGYPGEAIYPIQPTDGYANGQCGGNQDLVRLTWPNGQQTTDDNQYSPYSGDLLQPEEIFQLDQPIRASSNVGSGTQNASSPPTLLDLGSGNIEQKPNIYHASSHEHLTDSYYSLNDDNSTNSSHNNDHCFYANISDIHLNNNNNNNNNNTSNNNNNNWATMNINSHQVDGMTITATTSPFENSTNSNYYCMDFQTSPNFSSFKEHKRKSDFIHQNSQFHIYDGSQNGHEYYAADDEQLSTLHHQMQQQQQQQHQQQPHHHHNHHQQHSHNNAVGQHFDYQGNGNNHQYLNYFNGNDLQLTTNIAYELSPETNKVN